MLTFITTYDNNISNSLVKTIPKSDLFLREKEKRKYEREILKKLEQRDNIIITKASKGGVMVIVNVEDYIKEAIRQVSDTSYFKS